MTSDTEPNGNEQPQSPPQTWRVDGGTSQRVLDAQPTVEGLVGLRLTRSQVLDYLIKRGLETITGLPSPTADPIERR